MVSNPELPDNLNAVILSLAAILKPDASRITLKAFNLFVTRARARRRDNWGYFCIPQICIDISCVAEVCTLSRSKIVFIQSGSTESVSTSVKYGLSYCHSVATAATGRGR